MRQNCKVYSLEFTAPNDGTFLRHTLRTPAHTHAHTGRKPNEVKLYLNHPSLSFDDCEGLTAVQEAELTWVPAGEVQKALLTTRFVKFQSVNSLHIFVTSNTEDSPTTALSGLVCPLPSPPLIHTAHHHTPHRP